MCLANGKISFVVDGYYFEFLLGSNRGDYSGHPDYEFFVEERLPNSYVFKEHFKHILRVELPKDGASYQNLDISHETRAQSVWNPSKQLLLVTFVETAIIMSPDYCILKCYRNVSSVRWTSDFEVFASVETGHPTRYSRENFIINVETDAVREGGKE
jgi:hypothetical protein